MREFRQILQTSVFYLSFPSHVRKFDKFFNYLNRSKPLHFGNLKAVVREFFDVGEVGRVRFQGSGTERRGTCRTLERQLFGLVGQSPPSSLGYSSEKILAVVLDNMFKY